MAEPTAPTLPASTDGPAKAVSGWMSTINQEPPTSTIKPVNAPDAPIIPPAKPEPAAAVVPPKPPEGAAPPPEEDPEEKFPRTSDDWKKFKTKRKEKEKELADKLDATSKERDTLNEKLKGLSAFTDTPEYKAIVKERDELSERLRIMDVTQHPKFKAHYDSRVNAQIELAKRVVGTERADKIAKLLAMPDGDYRAEQIRDFVSELDVLEQSRIGGVLNALSQIETDRTADIAKAGEAREAMTANQKAAQDQQQAQIAAFIDTGLKTITDATKGHPAFQKRDGDTAWNEMVDKRIETVKNLLVGKVDKQQIFDTAVHAVAYHQVLSDNKALRDEKTKLEAQVKALSAAQPSLEGGQPAPGGNGEPAKPTMPKRGTNPMDATTAWVSGLKKAQNQ